MMVYNNIKSKSLTKQLGRYLVLIKDFQNHIFKTERNIYNSYKHSQKKNLKIQIFVFRFFNM